MKIYNEKYSFEQNFSNIEAEIPYINVQFSDEEKIQKIDLEESLLNTNILLNPTPLKQASNNGYDFKMDKFQLVPKLVENYKRAYPGVRLACDQKDKSYEDIQASEWSKFDGLFFITSEIPGLEPLTLLYFAEYHRYVRDPEDFASGLQYVVECELNDDDKIQAFMAIILSVRDARCLTSLELNKEISLLSDYIPNQLFLSLKKQLGAEYIFLNGHNQNEILKPMDGKDRPDHRVQLKDDSLIKASNSEHPKKSVKKKCLFSVFDFFKAKNSDKKKINHDIKQNCKM